MSEIRRIKSITKSRPTIEGAGVHLKRVFGYHEIPKLDPFLLLDHFGTNNPDDYIRGFPWHPHRGIETVTYMLDGMMEHGDSMGNSGVISSGDVQWMTAGGGIIHQEMPKVFQGFMRGFQLWVNLPTSQKMMEPRYRDVKSNQIPDVELDQGVKVKIISGEINRTKGPVEDIVVDPEYLDITVTAGSEFVHNYNSGYKVFAYAIEGWGYFDTKVDEKIEAEHLVVFDDGESVKIKAPEEELRFLLISGKPINEPVAWYGPIVMNTQEQLKLAFEEYENGTFIKHKNKGE